VERFDSFTYLISSLSRYIKRIKTEEMAEFNLKGPHVSCIYYIYRQNSLTAKELCVLCGEDKGAISRSLEYLEKNGFISCGADGGKRYKAPLSLTEKGEQTAKRICQIIDDVLALSADGITDEERLITYKSLEIINKNLAKYCEKYED
jgi:DNA-binding MarR family transcriptional regulator